MISSQLKNRIAAWQPDSWLFAAIPVIGCVASNDDTEAVEHAPSIASEAADPAALARSRHRTVRGTRDVHFLLDGRATTVPGDAGALSIAALVERHGTWRTIPAVLGSDGAFSLPGALERGDYLLRVTTSSFLNPNVVPIYFATDARELDLSINRLGRVDTTPPGAGTALALDLRGLDAWTPNDDLQLTSAGAGLGFSTLPPSLSVQPAAGATTLQAELDYSSIAAPNQAGLIDTSRGDEAFLTQLAFRATPDVFFIQELHKAATVPSLVMANQATSTVSVELAAVPRTTLRTSLRRDAFASLADSLHPGAAYVQSVVHIDVLPTGANRTFSGGFGDLALAAVAPAPGDQAIELSFGNPFPAAWPVIGNVFAFYQAQLSVPAPDGGPALTYTQFLTASHWDRLGHLADGGLGPVVGPVRRPRIDGHDLFGNVSGLSETPKLRWDRPALGSPDYYNIVLQELVVADGNVSAVEVAELNTTENHLELPPGLLATGKQYTIMIVAVVSPDVDLQRRPFATRFVPLANADTLSGVLSR